MPDYWIGLGCSALDLDEISDNDTFIQRNIVLPGKTFIGTGVS